MQDHFRKFDGPSVITKRNFGLLRGKTLQEAPHTLVKAPQQQISSPPNRRLSIDVPSSPPSSPDSGCWSPSSSAEHIGPVSEQRRATITFGTGGPLDRPAEVWDWPLGEPKVFNGDDYIEAQFNFSPFSAQEVWASVMGNELMVHCKTDKHRKSWIGQRELFRCYTLPLNVNPRTAEFSTTRARYLKIVIKKDLPLKLAIASYGLDLDENDMYDDRSDSELVSSITDYPSTV